MRALILCAFAVLALIFPASAAHNFTINGQKVFPSASWSDSITFRFEVETPGAEYTLESYADLNNNGVFDGASERYQFLRTRLLKDGDLFDADKSPDGKCILPDPGVLTESSWIYASLVFVVTDGGISDTAAVVHHGLLPTNTSLSFSFSKPVEGVWTAISAKDYVNIGFGTSDSRGYTQIFVPDSIPALSYGFISAQIYKSIGSYTIEWPDTQIALTGHIQGPEIQLKDATCALNVRACDPKGNLLQSFNKLQVWGSRLEYNRFGQEQYSYRRAAAAFMENGECILPLTPGEWWITVQNAEWVSGDYVLPDTTIRMTVTEEDTAKSLNLYAKFLDSQVAGKVLLDGKPVPDFEVRFSYGSTRTDDSGRFVLRASSVWPDTGTVSITVPKPLFSMRPSLRVSVGTDSIVLDLYSKYGRITGHISRTPNDIYVSAYDRNTCETYPLGYVYWHNPDTVTDLSYYLPYGNYDLIAATRRDSIVRVGNTITYKGKYPDTLRISNIFLSAEKPDTVVNIVFAKTGVAVSQNQSAATVGKLQLYPNSPNPFSYATTIKYAVPAAATQLPVSLQVLDSQGRLVRTLVQGKQNAGAYQTTWDGKDKSGNVLPTGIYMCRMRAGSFVKSQKITLMR